MALLLGMIEFTATEPLGQDAKAMGLNDNGWSVANDY